MYRKDDDGGFYNAFIRAVSVILILLGLIALGTWGWLVISSEGPEPAPDITPTNFFYATVNKEIPTSTSTQLASKVTEIRETTPLEADSFSNFYFTHTIDNKKYKMSSEEFLESLAAENLAVTDYMTDDFMYGQFQNEAGERTQYFVFEITDYESAYGSMLQDESTIADTFTQIEFEAAEIFTDEIIQNQDVRRTGSSSNGIFYSFPRQNRLVIASDRATLVEVFERLRQAGHETDS